MDFSRRQAVRLGGAGLMASLAGCGIYPTPPRDQVDSGASMRAKRPYQPADPEKFAAIINSYRVQNGLQPWRIDNRLTAIAADYANHLCEAREMTHTLAPYGGLERRLAAAGYSYSIAGENLGEGHTDMEDAFEGWRASPAHDRGMRDPDATVFGIASAYRPDDRYQSYWCLIFAKPRSGRIVPNVPGPYDLVHLFGGG